MTDCDTKCRSDTFAGLDDNAGDILVDELILVIVVDDRDWPCSGRCAAATETLIVEYSRRCVEH